MNLETVHFEELTMNAQKSTEVPATLVPELLLDLGAMPLDPADLPVPGEKAWESLRQEVESLEKDKDASDAK